MKATITIRMDNAAFEEPATELVRILRKLATKIEEEGLTRAPLFDINGNKVGLYKIGR